MPSLDADLIIDLRAGAREASQEERQEELYAIVLAALEAGLDVLESHPAAGGVRWTHWYLGKANCPWPNDLQRMAEHICEQHFRYGWGLEVGHQTYLDGCLA